MKRLIDVCDVVVRTEIMHGGDSSTLPKGLKTYAL